MSWADPLVVLRFVSFQWVGLVWIDCAKGTIFYEKYIKLDKIGSGT